MNPKTLHNSDASAATANVSDLRVVGNGDLWQLLCEASSQEEGWMKSTKAMDVGNGCLVQVTTQQRNPNFTHVVAEAVTFVPGVTIVSDINGGRRLISIAPAAPAEVERNEPEDDGEDKLKAKRSRAKAAPLKEPEPVVVPPQEPEEPKAPGPETSEPTTEG